MSTGFDRVEYFVLPMHRNFPKVMPAAIGTVGIQNYFQFSTANHALLFHAIHDLFQQLRYERDHLVFFLWIAFRDKKRKRG